MILVRANFINIPFNGQAHPASKRLCQLGIEYHTIEKSFPDVEVFRQLFFRFNCLFRHEPELRDLVFRALSGFTYQLKTDLLVHALECQ